MRCSLPATLKITHTDAMLRYWPISCWLEMANESCLGARGAPRPERVGRTVQERLKRIAALLFRRAIHLVIRRVFFLAPIACRASILLQI